MDDLTLVGDTQLDELRLAVLAEQERRNNLAAIPAQMAALRQTFLDGGGDPADLP